MNYSKALKGDFLNCDKPTPSDPFHELQQLPKGWIMISKKDKCIYENRTPQEIQEFEDYLEQQRINDLIYNYTQKYIADTTFDMERDGYSYEEIDQYLYNVFYPETDSPEDNTDESSESELSETDSLDDELDDTF